MPSCLTAYILNLSAIGDALSAAEKIMAGDTGLLGVIHPGNGWPTHSCRTNSMRSFVTSHNEMVRALHEQNWRVAQHA